MSKGWASFLIIVFSIPAGIWSAFVALRLWAWFAVPMGAPRPSLVQVMGLAIIVAMYRHYPDVARAEREGGEMFLTFIGKAALVPAVALFFGWLYTNFL